VIKRLLAASTTATILLMGMTLPVLAAELTGGCVLQARSFTGADATGDPIDEGQLAGIAAEGDVGDEANPFEVSLDGSVDFLFTTPTVFQNNTWAIYVQGLPIPLLQGSDDNPLDVDETGVVNLSNISDAVPFEISGVFFVHGDLTGNSGANNCHGEGYVKVLGDPVGTPVWLIAAALLVVGGSMLAVAVPYSKDWEVDQIGGERLHSGPIDQA
jgi:hypothetical protein